MLIGISECFSELMYCFCGLICVAVMCLCVLAGSSVCRIIQLYSQLILTNKKIFFNYFVRYVVLLIFHEEMGILSLIIFFNGILFSLYDYVIGIIFFKVLISIIFFQIP